MSTKESKQNTNLADVFIVLINGFFNLIKIEKFACVLGLYLIYRDYYFVNKLSQNSDVSKWLIDTNVLNAILQSDNTIIMMLGYVIVTLIIIILVILFWVIPIYKKEIERLTDVRSKLMHVPDEDGNVKIKEHKSSKKVKK